MADEEPVFGQPAGPSMESEEEEEQSQGEQNQAADYRREQLQRQLANKSGQSGRQMVGRPARAAVQGVAKAARGAAGLARAAMAVIASLGVWGWVAVAIAGGALIVGIIGLAFLAKSMDKSGGGSPQQQAASAKVLELLAYAKDEDAVFKVIEDKTKREQLTKDVQAAIKELQEEKYQYSEKTLGYLAKIEETLKKFAAAAVDYRSATAKNDIKSISDNLENVDRVWKGNVYSATGKTALPIRLLAGSIRFNQTPHGNSFSYSGKKPDHGTFMSARLRGSEPPDPVDLNVPAGTKVHAPISGMAYIYNKDTKKERVVIAANNNDDFVVLAHIEAAIKTGPVEVGDIVGVVSGRLRRPHLHLEVRLGGVNIHHPANQSYKSALIWREIQKALIGRAM